MESVGFAGFFLEIFGGGFELADGGLNFGRVGIDFERGDSVEDFVDSGELAFLFEF